MPFYRPQDFGQVPRLLLGTCKVSIMTMTEVTSQGGLGRFNERVQLPAQHLAVVSTHYTTTAIVILSVVSWESEVMAGT